MCPHANPGPTGLLRALRIVTGCVVAWRRSSPTLQDRPRRVLQMGAHGPLRIRPRLLDVRAMLLGQSPGRVRRAHMRQQQVHLGIEAPILLRDPRAAGRIDEREMHAR
ncbi:MAG: hypothetical protein K0S70_4711, partial [Microbacterium sp.]|nr:hypothetical protein [Microbacterium sp.]